MSADVDAPKMPSVGGDLPSASVPDTAGDVTVPSFSADVSGATPSAGVDIPSMGAEGEWLLR